MIGARRLQQREGADDVGLDELARSVDRAVDMALGGQMHDGVDALVLHHLLHRIAVADVELVEAVVRAAGDVSGRAFARGIGQLVDIDDVDAEVAHQMAAHRRPDEAASAGDHDFHALRSRQVQNESCAGDVGKQGRCRDPCRRAWARGLASGQSMPIAGSFQRMARSRCGRIGCGHLVEHLDVRLERQKAMGEALRNQQLVACLRRQHAATHLPKVGEPVRRSTATSKIEPRSTRISLSWA